MNYTDLIMFQKQCAEIEVAVPKPIQRGLELIRLADDVVREPGGALLSMTDDEASERVVDLAIRQGTWTMSQARDQFREQLTREVEQAMLPGLDSLVESLQPRFDELAKPMVTAAREYELTYATTPDDVILMADEGASAAYRGVRAAWHDLDEIVQMRSLITTIFGTSPTAADQRAIGARRLPDELMPIDMSVCFAAGDNWAIDGAYYIDRYIPGGQLDWLALAAIGLRLNTPTEVADKIKGRRSARIVSVVN